MLTGLSDPTFRKWLSIVTMSAAGLVLVLVLVWTANAALLPRAAGCHNPPLLVTRVPQLVAVLICVVGFVSGRITARPKISRRSDLKAGTGTRDEPTRAKGALLAQSALTAALFFITVLVAFEAVTLRSDVWPITFYMRCASEAATWQTLVAAFAFCFLAGRWLWLPTTPEDPE